MKISKVLVVGVFFLVFSILSLVIPLNADAALNAYLKLKEATELGATSSGYVLSGPDAEKAMQAINSLKRDCCNCSKVGKEIICTWKKGTSDCCANTLQYLQKEIVIPTKPSAPTGVAISGSPPSAPKGLVITGSTPSHPPPAIGYTTPQQEPIGVPGRRLVIRKIGDGTGTVTSRPSGINCGSTCSTTSATFSSGTVVTLSAAPDSNQVFGRWLENNRPMVYTSSACDATMDTDKTIEAMFRVFR